MWTIFTWTVYVDDIKREHPIFEKGNESQKSDYGWRINDRKILYATQWKHNNNQLVPDGTINM